MARKSAIDPDKLPSMGLINVIGPKEGRRRAGISFNASATLVDLSKLDKDQILAIVEDPQLVIRPAEAPAEAEQQEPPQAS